LRKKKGGGGNTHAVSQVGQPIKKKTAPLRQASRKICAPFQKQKKKKRKQTAQDIKNWPSLNCVPGAATLGDRGVKKLFAPVKSN